MYTVIDMMNCLGVAIHCWLKFMSQAIHWCGADEYMCLTFCKYQCPAMAFGNPSAPQERVWQFIISWQFIWGVGGAPFALTAEPRLLSLSIFLVDEQVF